MLPRIWAEEIPPEMDVAWLVAAITLGMKERIAIPQTIRILTQKSVGRDWK